MGTNYYVEMHDEGVCPTCGRSSNEEDEIHIGKSSYGWVFLFNFREGCTNATEWFDFLYNDPKVRGVKDEYGNYITREKFKEVVLLRSHPKGLWRPSDPKVGAGRHDDWVAGVGTWDIRKEYQEFC